MQSRRRRKKAGGGRCGKTSEAKPVFGQTVPIEDADGAPVSGNRGNTANGGRSAPRWERGRCAGRLGCGLFILTFKAISCAARGRLRQARLDRKGGVWGKSETGSVAHGGGRHCKKKKTEN